MGHYVGVDVGLRSSSLCIIDEQGKVCLEREVASEIEAIAAAIGGFAEHVDGVALETGNLTPWLTAGLRAEGFRVVVMEARQVKTTLSSLRNETDRNDARSIAQILRTGWYCEVHVKSLESQRLKTLLAARKALLRPGERGARTAQGLWLQAARADLSRPVRRYGAPGCAGRSRACRSAWSAAGRLRSSTARFSRSISASGSSRMTIRFVSCSCPGRASALSLR